MRNNLANNSPGNKLAYLKVLLTKDYLTLWRNKGFLIAFVILPIILMQTFLYVQNQVLNVDGKYREGSLVDEYFMYTSNNLLEENGKYIPKNFYEVLPIDPDKGNKVFISSLEVCR